MEEIAEGKAIREKALPNAEHEDLYFDDAIGPQYAGDPRFTARVRFHQSWYRANRLKVASGTGPTHKSTSEYGNMLALEPASEGRNFLSKEIYELYCRRVQEGPIGDDYRCRHNMLSSQPMCFNLFGPPSLDLELATRLFRALLGEEVAKVTEVKFEYAPSPIEEYLGDRTAFDAFVEYKDPNGETAFIGIETKLTDSFSKKEYSGPKYTAWTERVDSAWHEAAWGQLSRSDWNQLWRNQLLVEALKGHPDAPHGVKGSSMLVRHQNDRSCSKVVNQYRKFLKHPESFMDAPLNWLMQMWKPVLASEEERSWLAEFEDRYVNLEASEEAWRRTGGGKRGARVVPGE